MYSDLLRKLFFCATGCPSMRRRRGDLPLKQGHGTLISFMFLARSWSYLRFTSYTWVALCVVSVDSLRSGLLLLKK